MPKKPSQGPEFSKDREFGVILEGIRSDFRAFGEQLEDVQEKVGQIPKICERLDNLESEVAVTKTAISTISKDLQTVTKDLQTVKTDVATIKSTFATKKDLEEFNKRLTAVESR